MVLSSSDLGQPIGKWSVGPNGSFSIKINSGSYTARIVPPFLIFRKEANVRNGPEAEAFVETGAHVSTSVR